MSRKHMIDVVLAIFTAALVANIAFPAAANADVDIEAKLPKQETVALMIDAMTNHLRPHSELPKSGPRWTIEIPITAYSSDPWQTDDSPFITASGTHVRDGIVAANFLPIGTRVRIPELFGDKEFVVEDRMNKRYYYKMDIWMPETSQARTFGIKYTTVEVFGK